MTVHKTWRDCGCLFPTVLWCFCLSFLVDGPSLLLSLHEFEMTWKFVFTGSSNHHCINHNREFYKTIYKILCLYSEPFWSYCSKDLHCSWTRIVSKNSQTVYFKMCAGWHTCVYIVFIRFAYKRHQPEIYWYIKTAQKVMSNVLNYIHKAAYQIWLYYTLNIICGYIYSCHCNMFLSFLLFPHSLRDSYVIRL